MNNFINKIKLSFRFFYLEHTTVKNFLKFVWFILVWAIRLLPLIILTGLCVYLFKVEPPFPSWYYCFQAIDSEKFPNTASTTNPNISEIKNKIPAPATSLVSPQAPLSALFDNKIKSEWFLYDVYLENVTKIVGLRIVVENPPKVTTSSAELVINLGNSLQNYALFYKQAKIVDLQSTTTDKIMEWVNKLKVTAPYIRPTSTAPTPGRLSIASGSAISFTTLDDLDRPISLTDALYSKDKCLFLLKPKFHSIFPYFASIALFIAGEAGLFVSIKILLNLVYHGPKKYFFKQKD